MCFIWWFLSLVINSFICRWLVLQSDWFVILNWRLMVMLIQSFLNTSTRLISVLQSLVHHVGASFGGFFRWLIYSFVGDWCYNLFGLSFWTGDWWWCSSKASSTPLLDRSSEVFEVFVVGLVWPEGLAIGSSKSDSSSFFAAASLGGFIKRNVIAGDIG